MARTSVGCLRLVVRSEGEALRIAEAREIAGDLVQPDEVTHGLAHEVTVGDRRIAIGSHPDAGVTDRSANPAPTDRLRIGSTARSPSTSSYGPQDSPGWRAPHHLAVHLLDVLPGHRIALTDTPRNTLGVVRVASLSGCQPPDLPHALRRALGAPRVPTARPKPST